MAKWISEWQCPRCRTTGWGRGKASALKVYGHVYRALLCKACKWPMKPTGKALKVYATTELL